MKYLLPILLLLPLAGCFGTSQAIEDYNTKYVELQEKIAALQAAEESPDATLAQLEALRLSVSDALKGLAEVAKSLPDAAKKDVDDLAQTLPSDANGWLRLLLELGLSIGGVNFLRNRNLFTKGSRVATSNVPPTPPLG